jgi:hypothetical protein
MRASSAPNEPGDLTMRIDIKSRKLGRTVRFIARGGSGYVFVDPTAADRGRQLFDRDGNAAIARSATELRRVTRRYLSRVAE